MACSRGLRVLVVDDDPVIREIVAERLRRWGHEALVAAESREAMRRAREEAPDVVLTDVVLPRGSGHDLLRQLKSHDPRRPVVLMSAHFGADDAARYMRAGADDFLTKPVDGDELRQLLEAIHERLHAASRAHAWLLGISRRTDGR